MIVSGLMLFGKARRDGYTRRRGIGYPAFPGELDTQNAATNGRSGDRSSGN